MRERKSIRISPIKGMNKDINISKFSNEHSRDNYNISISKSNNGDMFSFSNEKGTKKLSLKSKDGISQIDNIQGIVIGACVIDKYLVVFSTKNLNREDSPIGDYIYKIYKEDDFIYEKLFDGNLNFCVKDPIEAIGNYENENIIKVYWTDDYNQPRYINIQNPSALANNFNFCPEINFVDDISITKEYGGGQFPSGVIQYAFSYWNKNGSESNIFKTSKQFYLTQEDRGASPDETVQNSFVITINDLDSGFDYLRVYSVIRTSNDTTAQCRIVADIKIPDNISEDAFSITLVDDGIKGSSISDTHILFVGGDELVVGTMTSKEGTLFAGNISIKRPKIKDIIEDDLYEDANITINPTFSNNLFGYVSGSVAIEQSTNWSYNIAHLTGPYTLMQEDKLTVGTLYKFTYTIDEFTDGTVLLAGLSTPLDTSIGEHSVELIASGVDAQIYSHDPYSDIKISKFLVTRRESIVDIHWHNDKSIIVCDSLNKNKSNNVYSYEPKTIDNLQVPIKSFRKNEYYRFGIQAQYKDGSWSEPVYLGKEFKVPISYQSNKLDKDYGNFEFSINPVYGSIQNNDKFQNVISKLYSNGFKAIRPVFVDPKNSDKSIIAQGVITNTIANVSNRYRNSPFAVPDYLSRPNKEFINEWPVWPTTNAGPMVVDPFSFLSYRDYNTTTNIGTKKYPYQKASPREITLTTSSTADPTVSSPYQYIIASDHVFITNSELSYSERYFIDKNVINLWTPEINDSSIDSMLASCDKLRLRGISFATAMAENYGSITNTDTKYDLNKAQTSLSYENISKFASTKSMYYKSPNSTDETTLWDAKQLLYESSKVYSDKSISSIIFSGFNRMFLDSIDNNITDLNIYKPSIVRATDETIKYQQDSNDGDSGTIIYNNYVDDINALRTDQTLYINYKANNHILLSLGYSSDQPYQMLMPQFEVPGESRTEYNPQMFYPDTDSGLTKPFYRKSGGSKYYLPLLSTDTCFGYSYDSFSSLFPYGYFWIVDLVRDLHSSNYSIQYGGQEFINGNWIATEESLKSNIWIPCGQSLKLSDIINNGFTDLIEITEGNTFIQRYDVLRTTPRSSDSWQKNSNVLSFICESYSNLDGRYDKHRYESNSKYSTFETYGKYNDVYSQSNNYFKYQSLDHDLLDSDNMPSAFAITNEKSPGAKIDEWTSIQLGTTYFVDGTKGKISKLFTSGENILGFQNKGLFKIFFNSRVQVNTSDGVPIELASSAKIDSTRYISKEIGSNNKWAIDDFKDGVVFIDSNRQELFYTNGESLQSISETTGCSQWFKENIYYKDKKWNPIDFDVERVISDLSNNDVYIITKDDCIKYSDKLQAFEGRYSYDKTSFMDNINNSLIANRYTTDSHSDVYSMFDGDYNTFFGNKKDSHVELFINPDGVLDKIFDNIQWRADVFSYDSNSNEYNILVPEESFNSLSISNEYQNGFKYIMDNTKSTPVIEKGTTRRFRIWNSTLPREANSIHRIRNPWASLKLVYNNKFQSKPAKLVFHDLIITYTI